MTINILNYLREKVFGLKKVLKKKYLILINKMDNRVIELQKEINQLKEENKILKEKLDSVLGYLSVTGIRSIINNCIKLKSKL